MVSQRCKLKLETELDKLGILHSAAELGSIEVATEIKASDLQQLSSTLLKSGLELIIDKKSILIEKVKHAIIELVHYSGDFPIQNYSAWLSERLGYDYGYLSNIFTAAKGVTIQHYIILTRIERVKELMSYNELNLTEISQTLHFSSVSHLSNQFKSITGMSPSSYRKIKAKRSSNLESI